MVALSLQVEGASAEFDGDAGPGAGEHLKVEEHLVEQRLDLAESEPGTCREGVMNKVLPIIIDRAFMYATQKMVEG